MQDGNDLHQAVGHAVLRSAWPVGVTLWGWTANAMPTVVGFATLIYIILQSGRLIWGWRGDIQRKREIDRAMRGPVAEYKPRIPK